jgi:hypothetical protein
LRQSAYRVIGLRCTTDHHLEGVLLLGDDIKQDIHARSLSTLSEPATVIEQQLVLAHLDVDRPKAGEVGVEWVDIRILWVRPPEKSSRPSP